MPRNRIVDVADDSRTVEVASHSETVEFMKNLRRIAERLRTESADVFETAVREYLATVPQEQRERIARGIMASLPGPRPDSKDPDSDRP